MRFLIPRDIFLYSTYPRKPLNCKHCCAFYCVRSSPVFLHLFTETLCHDLYCGAVFLCTKHAMTFNKNILKHTYNKYDYMSISTKNTISCNITYITFQYENKKVILTTINTFDIYKCMKMTHSMFERCQNEWIRFLASELAVWTPSIWEIRLRIQVVFHLV